MYLAAPLACRKVKMVFFFQSVPTAFSLITYKSPGAISTEKFFPKGFDL